MRYKRKFRWYIILPEGRYFIKKRIVYDNPWAKRPFCYHNYIGYRTKRKALAKFKHCPAGSCLGRLHMHDGKWYGGEEWEKAGGGE